MSDNRPIGVFDSGLGGLTVVRRLVARLPQESIVYFGDTARVPYGTKTDETIIRYSLQDAAFLRSHDVKMIVAACGTASSVAGDALRSSLPLPFMEMLHTAAQTAVAVSKNRRIGVLGTPATVRSKGHETLIRKLCPDAQVFGVPCPLFVPLVENGFFDADDPVVRAVVERHLGALEGTGADTVILGCTHYPLLRDAIERRLPGVTVIDPGEALADTIARHLEENGMLADRPPLRRFFVSDEPTDFARFAAFAMPDTDFGTVQRVAIENYQ
ncbi:MAG: glutamate racemase [Clostridia bacterium]|nr:glutamate racemase [Clostridia bacterium]